MVFFSVHAERDGEQRNDGSGLLHHRQTVSKLSPGSQCISHESPPILRNFPHCFPGMGKNTRHFFQCFLDYPYVYGTCKTDVFTTALAVHEVNLGLT